MDHRLSNIERLCRVFLTNSQHISRRERTEQIIKELHEATKPGGSNGRKDETGA